MPLPTPNLDDKTFEQIVEEARALIPLVAPAWTDHNLHDPGITFIEMFAWLAEIQQYRLNQVAEASFLRFVHLAGITRTSQQTAAAIIAVTAPVKGLLVPANSRVDPAGKEEFPFESVGDTYLTASVLKSVRTRVAERETDQTNANRDPAAHFAPFGPLPAVGDSLRLGFDNWFAEPEIHLTVELYEQGLPAVVALTTEAPGFVPSATIRWEYLAPEGWLALPVIEDGTLNLSRNGQIRFQRPEEGGVEEDQYWIRAILKTGSYEIAPRVQEIRVNSVTVRQVETIVNEDLGAGTGAPDQLLQVKKRPIMAEEGVIFARFEVGEVLDWQALVMRLARSAELHSPSQAAMVQRVADALGPAAKSILEKKELTDRENANFREPNDGELRTLASAFDQLLNDEGFYEPAAFSALRLPEEYRELAERRQGAGQRQIRRLNRKLLQLILADQMVSDRLELQTGRPVAHVEDEPKSWAVWDEVPGFSRSGPGDRHYVLQPETGHIRFGNGLNGRVPEPADQIRVRFYRHSRAQSGNLPAGQTWRFLAPKGAVGFRGINLSAASGGSALEPPDDVTLRARAEFRSRSRAITADDYEQLARRTPGLRVAQAKVLPEFNPKLPCIRMPGEITILILPYGLNSAERPPQPSSGFLRTIENFLGTVRLVATRLHAIGPQLIAVAVRATIHLAKGARKSEAKNRIRSTLNNFLDPVNGGPEGKGWPFGRAVFPSEIHGLLSKVQGVDCVAGVALNEGQPDAPLRIGNLALPYPAPRHPIQLVSFDERGDSRPASSDCNRQGDCRNA